MSWKEIMLDAIQAAKEGKLTPKDEIETIEKLADTPEDAADGLIQSCDNNVSKACEKLNDHLDKVDDGYRAKHPILFAAKDVLNKIVDEAVENNSYVSNLKKVFTEKEDEENLAKYTPIDPSVVLGKQDAAKVGQMEAYAMAGIHPRFIDERPMLRYIDNKNNKQVVVLDNIDSPEVESQMAYLIPVSIQRTEEDNTPYLSFGDKYAMPIEQFVTYVLKNDLNKDVVAEITKGESENPDDWIDEIYDRVGKLHNKFTTWRDANYEALGLGNYDDFDVIRMYQYMTKDGYSRNEAEYKIWRKNNANNYTPDQLETIENYLAHNKNANIYNALAALKISPIQQKPSDDDAKLSDDERAIKKYINSLSDRDDDNEDEVDEDDWEDPEKDDEEESEENGDVSESINFTEDSKHDAEVLKKFYKNSAMIKDPKKLYRTLVRLGIDPKFCVQELKMPNIFADNPADDEEGQSFKIVGIPSEEDDINTLYVRNNSKGSRPYTMDIDDIRTLIDNDKVAFENDQDWLWDKASTMYKQRQPLHNMPLGTWRKMSRDEVKAILTDIQQHMNIDLLSKYKVDLLHGTRNPLIIKAMRKAFQDQAIRVMRDKDGYSYYVWVADDENPTNRKPHQGHAKPFRDLRHYTGG